MQDAAEITTEAFINALRELDDEGKIHENQRTMLLTHYRSDEHIVTATELYPVVGYKDHRGVNRWYGELGKCVAEKVGYFPPEGYTSLSTLVTFDRESSPYPMCLRPNVVAAMEELGWE